MTNKELKDRSGKGKAEMMQGEGSRLSQNLQERNFIQESPEFYSDFGSGRILNSLTVSIIIPAYNEEKNVENVISGTIAVMEQLNLPYEIILVDDGSTDKTGLIASLFKVTVLTNKKNLGKGYPLKKALQYAHGDIIVTIDSDGEHKPKEIAPLLEAVLNGIDVAAGSRFMNNQAAVTTKLNQIGNHLFNLVIMSLTGKR